MEYNYFKGASKEYFGERKKSSEKKQTVKNFTINTKHYKKNSVRIETVEYELKE